MKSGTKLKDNNMRKHLTISIAAALIMRLPARQSSQILSAMDAKKAAMVARIMSSAANPQIPKDPS